jgi:pimeloyl-ACP methyl ester carboxylesterase
MPSFAGALSLRAFCTPLSRRPSRGPVFAKARSFELSSGQLGWIWGRGPAVYLVHGWGGSTGQLSDFIEPLVDAGMAVVALDQRAHGRAAGSHTNAIEMAAAWEEVAARFGQPTSALAHSMGGIVLHHAMQRGWLRPERAVLISAPRSPDTYFKRVLKFARIPNVPAVIADAERRIGKRFEDLLVGPALTTIPTLLLHDRKDREVPFSCSEELLAYLPQGELVETTGLGHARILNDRQVIERSTTFLSELEAGRLRPKLSADALEVSEEEIFADLAYGRGHAL